MRLPLGQRIAAWLALTLPSTALAGHPERYLPLSEFKNSFKCHYCSNISPGQWCLHCDLQPARGTYYDEHGNPCKPTARIRPLSKEQWVALSEENWIPATPGIMNVLQGYKPMGKPEREATIRMYKKVIYSREELLRVLEAFDRLGKDYSVVKRSGSSEFSEPDEIGMPRPPKRDEWLVTELSSERKGEDHA